MEFLGGFIVYCCMCYFLTFYLMKELDDIDFFTTPSGENLDFPDWILYIIIPLAGSMMLPLIVASALIVSLILLAQLGFTILSYWFHHIRQAFEELRQ